MNQNTQFDMRYKKLTAEALLKSLFCGLLVSFGANFVLGMVFWIIGIDSMPLFIGLTLGSFVLVTVCAGAIFYLTKFRPTEKSNAKRIDSLGLHERAITMIDYRDDGSVMAAVQRRDAMNALNRLDPKTIRFKFGKKLLISLASVAALSITLSLLAVLLPSIVEIIENAQAYPDYIPISYIVEEGGYITGGDDEQFVLMGESAETVTAVPEEGYSFEGWDDGYKKPTRTDENVDHPLVLTAIFVPIDEEGDDEGDPGESGENGDAPGEEEGDNGDSSNQGENPGDNPSDSGGDPSTRDQNFIIDGTEDNDYKVILQEYAKEDVIKFLKENIDKLTDEEREIIETYIEIL